MKRISKVFFSLMIVSVGLVAGWLACDRGQLRLRGLAPNESPVPILENVRMLSELTTLRVEVADAMETELRGYTGEIRAVIIVHGDVTIGVDLSSAKFESVDPIAHRAVLRLPRPQVESVRLDQERTKLLGVWSSGLWAIVPGGRDADAKAINDCYREAQRAVSEVGGDKEIVDRARRRAEEVLRAFFSAIGWVVDVHWAD